MNVAASGATLFVADALAGVRVMNSSNQNPVELGGLHIPAMATLSGSPPLEAW